MIQQPPSWAYTQDKTNSKDTCTLMFIAAQCTIAKTKKQPKCPSTDEWIKEDVLCVHTHTHTHNVILLGHKKEQNDAICSNMDATRDYTTK